mmetsp:Transcript_33969/g.96258  ORF Transcript_33969/g.96258 Transcript_33969/m.96258 type:complete len:92 (-) Transcript_33969:1360-1635(-)
MEMLRCLVLGGAIVSERVAWNMGTPLVSIAGTIFTQRTKGSSEMFRPCILGQVLLAAMEGRISCRPLKTKLETSKEDSAAQQYGCAPSSSP